LIGIRPGIRSGAGRQTRTADLLITNQLLYRLSYSGTRRDYKGCVFRARALFARPTVPDGKPGERNGHPGHLALPAALVVSAMRSSQRRAAGER
jgi:hypothetical protein